MGNKCPSCNSSLYYRGIDGILRCHSKKNDCNYQHDENTSALLCSSKETFQEMEFIKKEPEEEMEEEVNVDEFFESLK